LITILHKKELIEKYKRKEQEQEKGKKKLNKQRDCSAI